MEHEKLRDEVHALRVEIARLEGRVIAIERMVGGGSVEPLPHLTTKQHAALQMLLRGASNQEIAERFGVTVNTAKVYVRGLFAKFDVHNRASVVIVARDRFEAVPEAEYVRWSGGLPKDWDRHWCAPDPFAPLYKYDGEREHGTGIEEDR
jgi:DNA-binding CsgD family transcriptional regulator